MLREAFSYKFAGFGFWEDMFLPFFKEVLVLAQYDMCIYNVRYITYVARHFLLHCIYSGVQKQEGAKLSIISTWTIVLFVLWR